MTRNTYTKASWEQTTQLAINLHNTGLTADKIVPHLKTVKYTVNGVHYNAVNVAGIVQGMQVVEAYMHDHMASQNSVPTLDTAIELVNSGIDNGVLKYTKAKRIHIVSKR